MGISSSIRESLSFSERFGKNTPEKIAVDNDINLHEGGAMKDEFLTSLFISISTQIPTMLIWIIGISLSVYFRKRNPKKFLLTSIAFLVFLLNNLANSVFSAWIMTNFVATGEPSPQMTEIVVSFLATLSSSVAWVVLFFAIFNPKFNSVEGMLA